MNYKLIYTKSARNDIQKLDEVTKKRLGKKLLIYAQEPLTYAKKLTNSSLGTYRFRIGDYRIIFDLDRVNIVVLRVRHRREVYGK